MEIKPLLPDFEEVFIIDDCLFEDTISIVFTDNLNRSIKSQCEDRGFSPTPYLTDCATAVVCNVDEPGYRACWCLFDVNKVNGGIIVHECVHLAHGRLRPRGVKHRTASEDEIYAYLIQWFFNKIISFYDQLCTTQHSLKQDSQD